MRFCWRKQGSSKCISGGYGDFTAEMFVAQTGGETAGCVRDTILDLTGVIEP